MKAFSAIWPMIWPYPREKQRVRSVKWKGVGHPFAERRLRNPKTSLLTCFPFQRTGQLFVSSDFSFLLSTEQAWRIQVEMPSLGKSHHWAKNHTATTITNNHRSFMLILLYGYTLTPV
jgi:hypothetical protein